MIASLTGTLQSHTAEGAIVEVQGVGYDVIGLWLGRIALGTQLTLYTYNYLENQSIPRLIGCESKEARELLMELITVSGVGPKLGGKILDAATPAAIKSAITSADLDFLIQIKGLGKKTAQKIILDLGKTLVEATTSAHQYIYEALRELSFDKGEIDRAIRTTNLEGLSESHALSAILKTLGRSQ